jgi:hypothetical protein
VTKPKIAKPSETIPKSACSIVASPVMAIGSTIDDDPQVMTSSRIPG